jgi:hypothetical protein
VERLFKLKKRDLPYFILVAGVIAFLLCTQAEHLTPGIAARNVAIAFGTTATMTAFLRG